MAIAIVNICVDPRLSHDSVRAQMQSQLQSMGLKVDRIFITNEPGGNIGSSLRGTLDMLAAQREPIVGLAVLHHSDCVADAAGKRRSLESSLRELRSLATNAGFTGPVLAGMTDTVSQAIEWTSDTSKPGRTYSLLPNAKQATPAAAEPRRRRVP